MKKFEALERVQQAVTQQQAAGGDGGAAGGDDVADGKLTEEQLQEVFKQTSVFTVKSATAGPEFLYGNGASKRSGAAARSHGARATPAVCARGSPCASPDGHDDDDAYRSEDEWSAPKPPARRARTRPRALKPARFPAQGRGRVQRVRRPGGRRGGAGVAQAPRAGANTRVARRRVPRSRRSPRNALQRGAPAAPREPKPQKHILTAYNRDNQMLMRRKKVRLPRCGCNAVALSAFGCHQVVDPYELVLLKLPPPPLAASWGRMIQPYCPTAGARFCMRRALSCLHGLSCILAARSQAAASVVDVKCIRTPDVLALDLQKARLAAERCTTRKADP